MFAVFLAHGPLGVALLTSISVLAHFTTSAPAQEHWAWVGPGAVAATLVCSGHAGLWMVVTRIADYSMFYGSLRRHRHAGLALHHSFSALLARNSTASFRNARSRTCSASPDRPRKSVTASPTINLASDNVEGVLCPIPCRVKRTRLNPPLAPNLLLERPCRSHHELVRAQPAAQRLLPPRPGLNSEPVFRDLVRAGVDVAPELSHGTQEESWR